MAMKIPVVSSPITVNKEIVLNDENGFLVDSTNDWVDAIENLISNKQMRTSFGVNGFNKIVSEYSTKSSAILILNILNK
jgi:glycosyltransferase involved in cell wall biosynthesis